MFFRKSGLRRIGTDIEVLKRDFRSEIDALKTRVLILECPHSIKDMTIEEAFPYLSFSWGNLYIGRKYCLSCGKTLEYYEDKESILKARNKLMRELIALNEKEMKK